MITRCIFSRLFVCFIFFE